MTEPKRYYNLKSISEILGVHAITVQRWWKRGIIDGAFKSEISGEVLVPEDCAHALFEKYGVRVHDSTSQD